MDEARLLILTPKPDLSIVFSISGKTLSFLTHTFPSNPPANLSSPSQKMQNLSLSPCLLLPLCPKPQPAPACRMAVALLLLSSPPTVYPPHKSPSGPFKRKLDDALFQWLPHLTLSKSWSPCSSPQGSWGSPVLSYVIFPSAHSALPQMPPWHSVKIPPVVPPLGFDTCCSSCLEHCPLHPQIASSFASLFYSGLCSNIMLDIPSLVTL